MSVSFLFLKCVGKGLLNIATGGMVGVALDIGAEVAEYVWKNLRDKASESEIRAELQQLAEASSVEVKGYIDEVMEELTDEQGHQPDTELREQVEAYLQHIPAQIRRTLRRPSDPVGTTVPQDLRFDEPEDYLAILPEKLPRFHPGDRPLPGVDLEIIELLGVGGFGEVWKARNPHLTSADPVALKFCLDADAAQNLKHEAAVLDWLIREGRHPGIVQLKHTYLSAQPPCLEYEYIDGGDLAGLIQEWHRSGQGISPVKGVKTLRILAEIMAFAHGQARPIVHRDLKPANILVKRASNGMAIKVADFGIGGIAAAQAAREGQTQTTRRHSLKHQGIIGAYTPLYASPEQMRGNPPDPRDDVHALGVIWYQMMIGDLSAGPPSGGRWKKTLKAKGMTSTLLDLMESCFESRAEDRPKDAIDLLNKLEAALPEQIKAGAAKSPLQLTPVKDDDWIELVPVEVPSQPEKKTVPPPVPGSKSPGTAAAVAPPPPQAGRSTPATAKPKPKTVPPPVQDRPRRKPRSSSRAIGERVKLLRQHELMRELEAGLEMVESASKPVGLFRMAASSLTSTFVGMFIGLLTAGLLVLLVNTFSNDWIGIPVTLFWGVVFGVATSRTLRLQKVGSESQGSRWKTLIIGLILVALMSALLFGLWESNLQTGSGNQDSGTLSYRDSVVLVSITVGMLCALVIFMESLTNRRRRQLVVGRQKQMTARDQLLREFPNDIRDWGGSKVLHDRTQVERLTDAIEAHIDRLDAGP